MSALCLGAMTFGESRAWGAGKAASRAVFEWFAEHGGNFIDRANIYMNGNSEEFLGEFLTGRREQFVPGTKYSLTLHPDDPNAGGNHRKSLVRNLEESLRRLRTDYLDASTRRAVPTRDSRTTSSPRSPSWTSGSCGQAPVSVQADISRQVELGRMQSVT